MRCFGFGVRVALDVFRKVALLRDFSGAGFGLDCLVNWIGGCWVYVVWGLVVWLSGFVVGIFGFRVCGFLWVSGFYYWLYFLVFGGSGLPVVFGCLGDWLGNCA